MWLFLVSAGNNRRRSMAAGVDAFDVLNWVNYSYWIMWQLTIPAYEILVNIS